MIKNPSSQRYRKLSLAQKYEIVKSTETQRKLKSKYNCSLGYINKIKKNKDEIIRAYENSSTVMLDVPTIFNKSKYYDLNTLMCNYFYEAKINGFLLNGPMLKDKALEFSKKLGLEDFKASDGWLNNFKSKLDIKNISFEGVVVDFDLEAVQDWCMKLPDICHGFRKEDIFNAAETGLYFRVMPNQALVYEKEKCERGQLACQRLSILVCCSMTGEKLKPLVIGKKKSSKCFKSEHMTCSWYYNKKAWMVSSIWEDWLKTLNNEMLKQKRKILIFTETKSVHMDIELSNVVLSFFPKNCSSVLQPLNQGIFRNLKVMYRQKELEHMLNNHQCDMQVSYSRIDIFLAMDWVKSAWYSITSKSIHGCFIQAGFGFLDNISSENCTDEEIIEEEMSREIIERQTRPEVVEEEEDTETDEDEEEISQEVDEDEANLNKLRNLLREVNSTCDISLFVNVDKDLFVSNELDEETSAHNEESFQKIDYESDTNSSSTASYDSDSDQIATKPITELQVIDAIRLLKSFSIQKAPQLFDSVKKLDNELNQLLIRKPVEKDNIYL